MVRAGLEVVFDVEEPSEYKICVLKRRSQIGSKLKHLLVLLLHFLAVSLAIEVRPSLLGTVKCVDCAFLLVLYHLVPLAPLLVVALADVVPLPADVDLGETLALDLSSTKRLHS